jgi:excisionase family DNA binding protein
MAVVHFVEASKKYETTKNTAKTAESFKKNDIPKYLFQPRNDSNEQGVFFEKLVTKRELANLLCVSEGLINKLVGERGMPHIKLGRNIRFSVNAVFLWMEQKGFKQ